MVHIDVHDIMCHIRRRTSTLDSNVYTSSVFKSHKALSHIRTLFKVDPNTTQSIGQATHNYSTSTDLLTHIALPLEQGKVN